MVDTLPFHHKTLFFPRLFLWILYSTLRPIILSFVYSPPFVALPYDSLFVLGSLFLTLLSERTHHQVIQSILSSSPKFISRPCFTGELSLERYRHGHEWTVSFGRWMAISGNED
jgi:hypothetical protein